MRRRCGCLRTRTTPGIVASKDADPPSRPARGHAEGRTPPPPRRFPADRDGHRAGDLARHRRPARHRRDDGRARRPDAVFEPGGAAPGLRPAHRADAGRGGAPADHRGTGRDQGGRRRSLPRDPLGPAAPCRRGPAAGRRDRRGVRRRGGRSRDHGDGRPAHLHGPAIARSGGERDPGGDCRPVPGPRPHRLGSRRPRGGVSGSGAARSRVRGRPGRRPADHPARRGVGRRCPGAPGPRHGARTDRPRPGRRRRPGPVRGADGTSPWTCAHPRTGRPGSCHPSRPIPSPGSTRWACR